jgi:hypothetical protein
LTVFNAGEKDEYSLLEFGANQSFTIRNPKKIYTKSQPSLTIEGENTIDFLTTEWLNQKTTAKFEDLGTENGLLKFRVKLGDTETTNSEVLIYFDEALKIPVRQEFYSASGEQRRLLFSVEMKNFKSAADEKLFELPKDYRRVSSKEFQEIVRQERQKNE